LSRDHARRRVGRSVCSGRYLGRRGRRGNDRRRGSAPCGLEDWRNRRSGHTSARCRRCLRARRLRCALATTGRRCAARSSGRACGWGRRGACARLRGWRLCSARGRTASARSGRRRCAWQRGGRRCRLLGRASGGLGRRQRWIGCRGRLGCRVDALDDGVSDARSRGNASNRCRSGHERAEEAQSDRTLDE
jgi:hypothetical protein